MRIFILLFFLLSSCNCQNPNDTHPLKERAGTSFCEDEYFIVFLVDARHLDYTGTYAFFRSVASQSESQERRGGYLGHAWIYLQGQYQDQIFSLEGGHSGERFDPPAFYFDGIMNYNEYGCANPENNVCSGYESNPVKYLWSIREDGFFQKGSGNHIPTFAAKVSLSKEQFERVLSFIRPSRYPYSCYALTGKQCCSFVVEVAKLIGLSLTAEVSLKIAPAVYYGNMKVRLWEDPCYSTITLSTPDQLEKSLIEAVENGQAEEALEWYLSKQL